MPDPTTFAVDNPFVHTEPFLDWLREHGVEPNDTFRVDVGGDEITVHQYALNGEGKKYFDQDKGRIAYREPFTVPLERPVPEPSVHA